MDKNNKSDLNNTISSHYFFSFLYILFAWSLSVSQPVMNLLGRQPVFLIAHEFRGWSLVTLILALHFLPPLLFWFLSQLIGKISNTLKEWFIRITIALLLTFFFLSYVITLPFYPAVLIAIFGAIISTLLLIRIELIQTFSLWYAFASLFFILQFFVFSDARQLLPTEFSENNHSVANKKSPVYIYLLDELPLISLLNDENKIDESRFPTLSQFSQEATWYPNTLAISSATEMAIPAILSGLEPNKKIKVGSSEQYPINLFTLFAPSHAIHAVENTTRMCPPSICKPVIKDRYQLLLEDLLVSYLYIIAPYDLRTKLPPINDRWLGYLREIKMQKRKKYNFSARKNVFNSFIDAFDQYPKNTVHFLHVLLPHAPWKILPNLKLYGFYEDEGTPGQLAVGDNNAKYMHQWTNDEWATRLSWRKHLLQVGAVDSLLEKALDKIKALNQYDDATIIIVADHGSSFIPKLSRRFAHDANIPGVAAIPLFVKYPNQKQAEIDERYASNIDIVPTLLEVFGIKSGHKLSSLSLLSAKHRDTYATLIQQGWKKLNMPEHYSDLFNERLSHKNKLFKGQGWSGVYHPEGSKQFLNLPIDSLLIQKSIPNAITMKNNNLFSFVNQESQYVPAYYRLKLSSSTMSSPLEILVALNGKLVSHCYTFKHAPSDCAGLINPELFYKHSGQNKLRYFSVLTKDDHYKVNELMPTDNDNKAHIITKDNQRLIHYSSGKEHIINSEAPLYGKASIKRGNNNSIYQIYGWAGNTLNGIKAKSVSLFIDNKLYATTNLSMSKPYLLNAFGFESLVKSGFQINLPVELYPNIANQKLTVIALNENGQYSEINYTPNGKHLDLFPCFALSHNRIIPFNPSSVLSLKRTQHTKNMRASHNIIDAFEDSFTLIRAGNWYKKKRHRLWLGAQAFVELPSSEVKKTYQIDINAKPLLYKTKVDSQRVKFYLNDTFIEEINFNLNALQKHSIIFEVGKNKSPVLKLEMPDAIAPSSIGNSVDTRFLSLYLSKFTIQETSNDSVIKKSMTQ